MLHSSSKIPEARERKLFDAFLGTPSPQRGIYEMS
jgi:hypothetical protein